MSDTEVQQLCLRIATEAGLVAAAVEESKLEGKLEVARNLLAHLSVEVIAASTGLSVPEVEKLKQEQ